MQGNYKAFIDRMINTYEGGYCWDAGDPGGPTKYGITCYDLAEHRNQKMTSMGAWASIVRAMPLTEAEDIYDEKYARGVRFNALPTGIDVAVLDYAVNSGLARARRVVCTLLGVPGTTITDDVIARLTKVNQRDFVHKLCAERLAFMKAIKGGSMWKKFGRGWQNRVSDLETYANHIIDRKVPFTAPTIVDGRVPKATNVVPNTSGTTAGGAITIGLGSHAAGLSFMEAGLVAGAVLIAGLLYGIWASNRAKLANATVHA